MNKTTEEKNKKKKVDWKPNSNITMVIKKGRDWKPDRSLHIKFQESVEKKKKDTKDR